MEYSNQYTKHTRDELIKLVSAQMSDKRFQHVLRVEKKALELAEKYDVDLEKASIAALTHDYAKERPDEEMITLIRQSEIDNDIIRYGNNIWHGIVGARLVLKELGISNQDILKAIESHTTGSQSMSELEKVIYVADYIEEGRHFPVVEEARLVANKNLDEAVAFETKHTLLYLINNQNKIYPKTLETYNAWVVR
ncbi:MULTISPECIES: bis(5'-nucleosyl)-tetraphosphatase (symmetrical) YqeK [Vagococcus]|uniref:bis(5'-nucleosyl)-tetraphosphatase (symmetrical) n=1 Tax=Vagococcus fluvialis bH819 TaxID=1255619 RepID=A0A1X6WJZ6_9ENTE|nr:MULTISPECIES: bis(5'-nucleosyl)-tetraphosphatase (symmetrical) YqeK [Vagococcus]SLM84633.1 Hydrolase (HAD superfamily), YqeK [Vagococcus fluvialis bH819]HCM89903.1 HD domain-containing protein [Vagococcus sp.]